MPLDSKGIPTFPRFSILFGLIFVVAMGNIDVTDSGLQQRGQLLTLVIGDERDNPVMSDAQTALYD